LSAYNDNLILHPSLFLHTAVSISTHVARHSHHI